MYLDKISENNVEKEANHQVKCTKNTTILKILNHIFLKIFNFKSHRFYNKTRTKTIIRQSKENDREKRKRKKGRRKDIEREGEIIERDNRERERGRERERER